MHQRIVRVLCIMIFFAMLAGCVPSAPPPSNTEAAPLPLLQKVKETERFIFHCSAQEMGVVEEIEMTLEAKCGEIERKLGHAYSGKIRVEVYPDQKRYDENLMDKDVAGSPACSGNGTIQMVSPKSPIRVAGIPYEERLMMAVHEYVHLMTDQINPDAPIWLDEGLASYLGSADGYDTICRMAFPQLTPIRFTRLESDYPDIPAPDVYSCAAVRFIIETYGQDTFNRLLRQPESFERILAISKDAFDQEWNEYIQKKYR